MSCSQSLSSDRGTWKLDFVNFAKLKKTKLPEKFELLDKKGFELMEKRQKRVLPPRPIPIIN